jgi:hypothetical protein
MKKRFSMRRIFLCCCVLFFLCFGFPAFGQISNIDPFVIPSARFAGLGGNHVAMGDSFHTLFTNPAAFVGVKEQFSAAELTISTYGPLFEIMDLAFSASGSMEKLDLSGVISKSGPIAGLDMAGPISLGWVGNGWGLGIFNRTKADAAVSGSSIRPAVAEEVFAVGGYSFRLINIENHFLDAGFLIKGFFRGLLNMETPIFDALSLLDDPLERPFGTYLGLGFDLGLRYTLMENFVVSLVCFDVYSPVLVTEYRSFTDFSHLFDSSPTNTSYGTVKRRLDFGVKYSIRSSFLDKYISDLTIMADYRDILDLFSVIPRNPVLNIGIGIELMMFNVLSFRFGISDALPAFGIGLDLSFMTVDIAISGRELGLDPGKNSTYCLTLGFLFRY